MRNTAQPTPGNLSGDRPAPPYPARQRPPANSEMPGQPHRPIGPGTRARDSTTSLAVPEPQVRQGRGKRAQAHVDAINHAADAARALRESLHALTSVITQACRRDPDAGGAWAWTVIHLVDGLCVLIEHACQPHPWFTDRAHWRLSPAGWAPPDALAQVAARIAGRRPRNGES
jgi:hypothetical protein